MKKFMFTALAVASCNAFAAAAPEPEAKAYTLSVTEKSIQPLTTQMTKKNIPADEVAKAWADAEAAAPEDFWGNKNFHPDADDRAMNPGVNEETNKNGTVTIWWSQFKPAKNGTNIVASTKVVTTKKDYYFFYYGDNSDPDYGGMVAYSSAPANSIYRRVYPDMPAACKYFGRFVYDLQPAGQMVTGDGKAWNTFAGYDPYIEEGFCSVLAGQGKAAKSNPADKSSPYDYMKSVSGNLAGLNGSIGTFKASYDKKLSQAYQAAIDTGKQGSSTAIAEALLTKKIYLPITE